MDVALRNGFIILGIFDDQQSCADTVVPTYPGLNSTGSTGYIDTIVAPVIVCIGDNQVRSSIVDQLRARHCSFLCILDSSSLVSKNVTIGDGTVVLHRCTLQRNVSVGRHVIVNTAASVDHDSILGDFSHISPNAAICGFVKVGDGAHIGAGAVVTPKVSVGKWAVVGAGSVVFEDVPEFSTVVGNPARIVKRVFQDSREGLARVNLDEQLSKKAIFDVLFVGSGLSSSATLIFLIDQLYRTPPASAVKICICEASGEFHKGIAYGERSGRYSLTITSLLEFLPNDTAGLSRERDRFIRWLESNREWVLKEIESCSIRQSKLWREKTVQQILNNEWGKLFLPRWIFGCYLSERVTNKLKLAFNDGLVEYEFIAAEITDLIPADDGYWAITEQGSKLLGRSVVLGTGSPPTIDLLSESDSKNSERILLVGDCFTPSIEYNLNLVYNYIAKSVDKKSGASIAVIGSNASAMEFLHHLKYYPKLYGSISRVFTISTSSEYPSPNDKILKESSYVPMLLSKLYRETKSNTLSSVLTAQDIFEAARTDLESSDIDISLTLAPISKLVGSLCDFLSEDEEREFVCHTGTKLGRLQRRGGKDYMAAIASMINDKKLTHIRGRFVQVKYIDDAMRVIYQSEDSLEEVTADFPVDVLLSCVGTEHISASSRSPLLRNLLSRQLCKVNPSGRGLSIRDDFSTSERLYVIGPMLAGNIANVGELNQRDRIWHTEHCGRILQYSAVLAENLVADIVASP